MEKESTINNNQQKNKKESKTLDEKDKEYEEDNLLQGGLEIKFSEFDPQKGRTSPRMLFRKRKNEDTCIYFKKDKNNEDIFGANIKPETKINSAFEAFLDYVREIYFTNDHTSQGETAVNSHNHNSDNRFKFTSLDLLLNPLRKSIIWETWSPYEIALFNCCICKFGTNFDLFLNIITTKKKEEIIDFYYIWKSSKYYKLWKNKRNRKSG